MQEASTKSAVGDFGGGNSQYSKNMENNKWLSPKKAAEIAGVNEDTIRRWDAEGKIKCIRTEGGHRRCDRDSLMKYLYKTGKRIT